MSLRNSNGRDASMNAFFKKHGVSPERIELTSGPVDVPRFSWRFRSWVAKPVKDTYGGKAILDCEGYSNNGVTAAARDTLSPSGLMGKIGSDCRPQFLDE